MRLFGIKSKACYVLVSHWHIDIARGGAIQTNRIDPLSVCDAADAVHRRDQNCRGRVARTSGSKVGIDSTLHRLPSLRLPWQLRTASSMGHFISLGSRSIRAQAGEVGGRVRFSKF